ncbi:MAG: type II toxin-antitoxin system RelE/ParE family toxin [Endomicrobium sp.]|jgi:phage-related protein|nr:type II toxin-antitoxin system RelE/ParE family toxin [Endomicrobium sp.]
MFKILFFTDKNGNVPIKEYIYELGDKGKTDKSSRIQFTKIMRYINLLEKTGTRIGKPTVEHLRGDIWELRPLQHRILFAWITAEQVFVLLHHFIKKTQKTPIREIEQAEKNLIKYLQ